MSNHVKTSDRVLGIAATQRAVHAVLLEAGPSGPTVLRRFSRQRAFTPSSYDESVHQPIEQKKEKAVGGGDDFTIEFGDGSSASKDLFLSSEFGMSDDGGDAVSSTAAVQSYELELGDILAEVNDAGYGDAVLAFALNASESPFQDLTLPSRKSGRHNRDALTEALAIQFSGAFDADRAFFIPMNAVDEGEDRYLAVFPRPSDAASATLKAVREMGEVAPQAVLLDSELTVLLGLARAAKDVFGFSDREALQAEERVELYDNEGGKTHEKAPGGNTLIVRAGAEDTLVTFLSGNTVHHAEILRSLTAFDQAETICSRVLLQQDEHGMGEVDQILILSEERESELAKTFGVFFPDARVEMLRSFLPEIEDEDNDAPTALASACGAALRALTGSPYADAFENVNFLPKKLARKKVKLPISTHMVALGVLIVVTTLFFMTRYSSAENEMAAYRDRLETVAPEEVNQDITVLQSQIDSMQNLYNTYTRAIEVLDTLLIGSDRWSRVLENTSKEASSVSGFWIETMQQEGSQIRIEGNATSRDKVVVFASRVDGIIESLSFSQIREWPVYSYSMAIPVLDSLPEAARYLRNSVKLDDEPVVAGNDEQPTQQNDGAVR